MRAAVVRYFAHQFPRAGAEEIRVQEQPNILVLMADQLTAGALSAYGNRVARTPRIDELAANGNDPQLRRRRSLWLRRKSPTEIVR